MSVSRSSVSCASGQVFWVRRKLHSLSWVRLQVMFDLVCDWEFVPLFCEIKSSFHLAAWIFRNIQMCFKRLRCFSRWWLLHLVLLHRKSAYSSLRFGYEEGICHFPSVTCVCVCLCVRTLVRPKTLAFTPRGYKNLCLPQWDVFFASRFPKR